MDAKALFGPSICESSGSAIEFQRAAGSSAFLRLLDPFLEDPGLLLSTWQQEGCLFIQQTGRVRVPTPLTLSWWVLAGLPESTRVKCSEQPLTHMKCHMNMSNTSTVFDVNRRRLPVPRALEKRTHPVLFSKRTDSTGRGWQGEPRDDCQAQPLPTHLALRVLCGGSTTPGSLRPWPHPFPLTGRSLHLKTPRAELADLAHPLFLHCIGYSMSVIHKYWIGVGRRVRVKVPFALKELTPCSHHHLMN